MSRSTVKFKTLRYCGDDAGCGYRSTCVDSECSDCLSLTTIMLQVSARSRSSGGWPPDSYKGFQRVLSLVSREWSQILAHIKLRNVQTWSHHAIRQSMLRDPTRMRVLECFLRLQQCSQALQHNSGANAIVAKHRRIRWIGPPATFT